MATDFWVSSHYKRWIVDRATLKQSRAEIDLHYVEDPEYLDFLAIYFANVITKLGKKLQLRQKVIATATVFFRRFYMKNSYCETDPFIVISACCYVAAKAEESPIHIKNVMTESRTLFSQEIYNVKHFPTDNSKLAEMEFYLVDDLECDLIVFHPYRTLLTLCRKEDDEGSAVSEDGEAGEVGTGLDDGPRYWGSGQGQLELAPEALQTAWSIINDTYRSELCLVHPPHLIAIAAIYLTFILHPPTRPELSSTSEPDADLSAEQTTPQPRRSSRQAHNATSAGQTPPKKPQDPITFLSQLNVSLPLIATIAQEIISLYTLWDRYKEDATPDAPKLSRDVSQSPMASSTATSPAKRLVSSSSRSGSASMRGGSHSASAAGTPDGIDVGVGDEMYITPSFLSATLLSMREARLADLTHAGRSVAVNKMLERTQAAG